MSGIAAKQNVFNFKIAPHEQISIVKNIFFLAGRWAPWPMGPYAEAHITTMVYPALV